ncbi:MAG: hypothetical protein M1816_006611 [Peltula sp. TS41687]|nr:MAG: hypothetical protein M1816_006611 [Peltula sp. TS41687]
MSNRTIDVFEGWHKYPHNLLFSLIEVDPLRCNDRLARDAERLFVPEEDSRLGMLEFGPVGQGQTHSHEFHGTREVEHTVLESSEQLSACFKRSYSSWIFFIRQSYTWSRLLISEEIFRRLFTRLKVHPDFLDVVHIFGEKVGPVEESFSAFFAQLSPQPSITTAIGENVHSCSYEIGFNIKYVAEHGRSYPNDPYSIRETGVYQKYCSDTQTCNWIFIQPSDEFRDRLERALVSANDAAPMNQFQIHVLVLLSVSENWRDYINYLEGTFSKLVSTVLHGALQPVKGSSIDAYKVDRGFFTNIKGPAMEGDIEADFSDIRRLQILTDKLRRLVHILQLNTNLGVQLKSSMQRVKTASPVTLAAAFEDFDLKIDLYLFQHQTHSARLQSLIARGQGISSLTFEQLKATKRLTLQCVM